MAVTPVLVFVPEVEELVEFALVDVDVDVEVLDVPLVAALLEAVEVPEPVDTETKKFSK